MALRSSQPGMSVTSFFEDIFHKLLRFLSATIRLIEARADACHEAADVAGFKIEIFFLAFCHFLVDLCIQEALLLVLNFINFLLAHVLGNGFNLAQHHGGGRWKKLRTFLVTEERLETIQTTHCLSTKAPQCTTRR
jgi:hypothetical protein